MPEYQITDCPHVQQLSGAMDKNLKLIEKRFGVRLLARGDSIRIESETEEAAKNVVRLLTDLSSMIDTGKKFDNGAAKTIIDAFHEDPDIDINDIFNGSIRIHTSRREISPRSTMQKEYLTAMMDHDICIAIGPAGTGKTYLAMAAAVSDLLRKRVSRIILTRPAVEAGERLGFLPGDLAEKIDPYLRPLHDALFDMLDAERVEQMMEQGQIEIAPLAFMRGRTLNDAFIILDEAQNTTPDQMKMFLTRLGFSSKAVITGDVTQVDLPSGIRSGLKEAQVALRHIEGIAFIQFSERDVVRHELVKKILRAYDAHEKKIFSTEAGARP